jgi:hypothetical protein
VVSTAAVLRYLTPAALRWWLASGRWQQPCRGVVVAQSGPLSATQRLWVALLWGGGEGASVAGGAEALSELELTALLRRYGIPEPDRQASRRDQRGRRRWLDAVWEAAKVIVEVDGFWHTDAATWWADMSRDNDFTVTGYRVLRFPAFAIRTDPDRVAQQIMTALRLPATTERAVRPRVTASRSDRPSESPGRRPGRVAGSSVATVTRVPGVQGVQGGRPPGRSL